MSQQCNIQQTYTKGDIQLAIEDIKSQRVKSENCAATIFKVPQTTIQDQRAGRRPQRDCEPNSKRLTKLEEEVIVQRVIDESLRGVPLLKANVQDMADKLLSEDGAKPVGKN